MKKYLITGLLIMQLSLVAFGQGKAETVDILLEKSGALTEIRQLDQLFEAKIIEKKASFTDDELFEKFSASMKSSFNSEMAEKYFKDYFIKNSQEDSLQGIIKLYENPLFKKMRMVEVEANDPAKQQDKMDFFQNMKDNPPSQNRINQLVELNKELGSTNMAISMLKNIIFSMANGANMAHPEDEQISKTELKENLEAALPADYEQQLTNQLVALSLYTYKDVNDADLNEYITYWKSDSGKYYMQLLMDAYDFSFSQMGEKMGESLSELGKS